jgi:CRP-like cAMP-binding protein
MSLIDQELRSAGVVALSPVEVLEITRETFLAIMEKYPLVAQDIMRNLARRLRFATTYAEQVIEWSHRIAEGDYSFAMRQIQDVKSTIVDTRKDDDARANQLLSAFFRMVEGVQRREQDLKQQLQQMSIEIDEKRRKQEVEKLTESTFFTNLKSAAQQLRAQRRSERDEE